MSGPLTFRITDRQSITSPPSVAKEWTDVSMVVFDFNSWLGPDQYLGAVANPLFQVNPQTQTGVWVPFPGGCCQQEQTTPPDDTNPLTLHGLTVLPGGRAVELSVGNGTPGLAYLATFLASAGPYPRRKEVGVVLSCLALRPLAGAPNPFPPTVPAIPSPINVTGTIILLQGSRGNVNINNTSEKPITITLPPNPTLDQSLTFKDVAGNASTYPITIVGSGSLIDNQNSRIMFQDYEAVELYWIGPGWGVR